MAKSADTDQTALAPEGKSGLGLHQWNRSEEYMMIIEE